MTEFDRDWSISKLQRARDNKEIEAYAGRYLPELASMEAGFIVDIGCGDGTFLSECRGHGHTVLGIDAETGEGGMGGDYLNLCRERCDEAKIEVWRCGLQEVMMNQDDYEIEDKVALFHSRGSIEQCFSECMEGEPHHITHLASGLDWIPDLAYPWLDYFFSFVSSKMKTDGILLIHANGTKSTNEWYNKSVVEIAEINGFNLTFSESTLLHKWIKR